jgi:molybdopterin molybdotransferase
MDFFQCLSLTEAWQTIYKELKDYKTGSEVVSLMDSYGRTTDEDVFSTADLPSFSRSTIDGYAVRSADTFGASETVPAMFKIIGEVKMGEGTDLIVGHGEAVAIPTGGMMPQGADTAVMVEYTEKMDEEMLMVLRVTAPRENVISKGEDSKAGQLLIPAGRKIASRHIAVLAANGIDKVKVRRKLKVGVLSTGNELVEVGTPLKDGQIWNSNSYALAALIQEAGHVAVRHGLIEDTVESFTKAITESSKECDAVILSGGSSVGVRDCAVSAIDAIGEPGVLFHGLLIKPGKPSIFGKAKGKPVFGLPGHPLAAITVCEALVLPALALMTGEDTASKIVLTARLMRNIPSASGRDDFVHVKLIYKNGEYEAHPILGKSGIIRLFADADGMIKISDAKTGLKEGEIVEVFNVHQINKG